MNKTLISSLIAGALAVSAAGAHAQQEGWYVGGNAGQSILKEDLDGPARDIANTAANMVAGSGFAVLDASGKGDEEDTAYKFYVGYQYNPNFALEAGYIDLGEFDMASSITITDGLDTVTAGADGSVNSTGFFVSLLGSYPVSESFDLFGKVGMYYYDTDADLRIHVSDGISSASESVSGGNSDEEVTWGLGVRYHINQWAIRAEYERFERLEADEDLDLQSDVDVWSVGVEYRF